MFFLSLSGKMARTLQNPAGGCMCSAAIYTQLGVAHVCSFGNNCSFLFIYVVPIAWFGVGGLPLKKLFCCSTVIRYQIFGSMDG